MSWTDPQYEMEGESGGGGNVVGFPSEFYFEDGTYGPQARIVVRRSHPELTPQAKVEVNWSYNIAGQQERANWSVLRDGAGIAHVDGKQINSNTDLGRLFASVKKHLPYVEGFDPRTAASWLGLEKLGDIEFGWLETPKRMPDPADPSGKKWITDESKDPKRTLIVVGYTGQGAASNGQVELFNVLDLPAEMIPALARAATAAGPGSDSLLAEIVKVPGATGVQPLMQALSTKEKAEALRAALIANEPF